MDDLDHSVLIAEKDWDFFCVESEECSVQQAKLAALDESGFSDTDDDKSSACVSTCPDQLYERDSEEGQNKNQIVECKINHASENSEFSEHPSPETEPQNTKCAEQTSSAGVNEEEATCECHNKANQIENSSGNDDNQENGENKSSQATTKPVSEMSPADLKLEKSTDGIETPTEVTGSLPVSKEEKERWFVTVNDSPVRLRVKGSTSVQKKRRKKKLSKKLRKNKGEMETCSSLNDNTELDKEIIERQTMQNKFEEDNVFSDTANIQNILKCISSTGSFDYDGEKTSSGTSLKKGNMAEFPDTNLERNLADSLNTRLAPKQLPQIIFEDLSDSFPQHWDHESTDFDKSDKSIEDINCECRHAIDNLSHFNNETAVESPRFILGPSKPTAPPDTDREKTEQQEPLGQTFNNRDESSQETQSSSNSTKTSAPTRPIFAISSFWDEMEKLTINDILQLRMANNRSLLKESIIPEESSSVDAVDANLLERGEVESKNDSLEDCLVDDAEDSDYFTHLDDSKPYRSSCEFSTYSDFDDEFLQLLHASANPTPEPRESKEQTQSLLKSTCDNQMQNESNEIVKLFPETDPLLYMYSETKAEMQDIFLTTKEDNNFLLDHSSMRRLTPSPVLSMSDILDDQCLLSFFEVLNSDTETEWISDRNTLLHFSQNESLAETHDDFYSDFEVENFLSPSLQDSTKTEKTLVPIYSSSHSVVKNLEFPKAEEEIRLNSEDENTPIRVMSCAGSSETSNMCFITNPRSTWRNLSLRHTKLLMGGTLCRMTSSWGFAKTAGIVDEYGTRTRSSFIAQSNRPVLLLENQALGQRTKHQIHIGATVPSADRDLFLFSLKQADMCLVCIALASWVLKSSNPQSTDMWKAALLANVSAISAIQYLRQYIKEG